jgi:hypothetical protein
VSLEAPDLPSEIHNPHTLQAKIRSETPLTATESAALVAALKRFRLATVA